MSVDPKDRLRRWRLLLGAKDERVEGLLSADERRMDQALGALYGTVEAEEAPGDKRQNKDRMAVGHGASRPTVARWLGDVRTYFPQSVVKVVQKDAFERLNLHQLLTDPEFLETVEPDVHLVATLTSLRGVMPAKAKASARLVVAKVVEEVLRRLQHRTQAAIRGALDRSRRTRRPRFADVDWHRTIGANLRHYQAEHRTIIPETLVGFGRKRRLSELDDIILCVDQSGSMQTSVVYASIFAAVLASVPAVRTRLVCYDTAVVDLSDELSDPVEVIFGVQLGGGNDTPQALRYCEQLIQQPTQTHLVLISDLYEGALSEAMLGQLKALVQSGVQLVVLLALNDDGQPGYDETNARAVAAMGVPVFACTPDQFPDLMAAALRREDLHAWAAGADIALVRADPDAR